MPSAVLKSVSRVVAHRRAAVYAIRVLMGLAAFLASGTAPDSSEAKDCGNPPGRHRHTLEVEGVERHYIVDVGTGAWGIRAPLVFLWHGFGSNAENIAPALAPERDWPEALTVIPMGLPRTFPGFGPTTRPGWQISPGEYDDRDLAFFDALVADLESRYCVDPRRRYSTGFSNGGFFSNLLACKRGRVLAAIAPVGGGGPGTGGGGPGTGGGGPGTGGGGPGTGGGGPGSGGGGSDAGCGRAVPVRIVHGTHDEVVPFRFARETYGNWTAHNQCEDVPRAPESGCVEAQGCRSAVTLCSFAGGHRWPRGEGGRVAKFFEGQTLPE